METPEHENVVLVFYPHFLGEQCTTANFEDGTWFDYKGEKIDTNVFRISRWKEIN